MNSIEERLKYSRQKAGLSQKALSERLGITQRTLQRYERDATSLTVNIATNISSLCDVDLMWLLTGKDHHSDSNETSPIFIEHQKIIKRFNDPELGKILNEQLVVIQDDLGIFKGIINSIKSAFEVVSTIKQRKSDYYPEPNMENLEKELKKGNPIRREGGQKKRRSGEKED